MESKNIQQTSEYNKKETRLTDIENKLAVITCGVGDIGVEEREVQTIGCKMGLRIYCATREI